MAFLEMNQYCKKIKDQTILDHINLKLERGNVYGFWGRNGSGKTMLFRAVSGLIYSTSGEVIINGQVLHQELDFPPNLGLLIEDPGFYPNLSGLENLRLLASINQRVTERGMIQILKKVSLYDSRNKAFRKYSLGMKQRLGIAQAVMENPDIIILDEPTNALDEAGVDLVKSIVAEEKTKGKLILLSSHNKEDLEMMSDIIYHMDNGSIKGEL